MAADAAAKKVFFPEILAASALRPARKGVLPQMRPTGGGGCPYRAERDVAISQRIRTFGKF
jgi:hypothetical protein